MEKLSFYFNMKMCIGCRTCQIACKDINDLKVGTLFRRVQTYESGTYPEAGVYNYAGTCNHCAEPKCVKGCPTGAMYIAEDGTVQHKKDKCIGCKYCMWNCPYGVPQFIEEAGIVGKCDSCKDLRDMGENPACVDACPMRALEFGDLDELTLKHGADIVQDLPILPSSSVTNPSTLINPKNCALVPNYKERVV